MLKVGLLYTWQQGNHKKIIFEQGSSGNQDIVELLTDRRADITARDYIGRTPSKDVLKEIPKI